MDVTLSGIVMLVRLQQKNAIFPMDVRPSGRLMSVRLLHEENAFSPIEVTELGISILVALPT